MRTLVHSLEETKKLAKRFADSLNKGDVVLLNGDLGAGKTTFTQFVFAFLGVKEVVNSPTFAILKTYKGKCILHHFDTYRISSEEAIEAGFDEVLGDRDSIIFIEWSENIAPLLPKNTKKINIKVVDENTREFEIDE
ncbi:MAG: tRNA (adenosine(37)-N6)-threonylcarbamoyltransferase complex ATPase subunit type 1 TsaE [Clostridiales bacterium]|nr:tRNA (adenosine(37)-N6)-threonylcarbamoyltransferase complex ATPase subunit type 1 TsaE [Clostridiales bacterium]